MKNVWITEGFEAFRRGVFGCGGQNLYVSRKGVLQRIFQYDLDRDGYFDLVFANCQNHHESAPSFLWDMEDNCTALPGQGSIAGLAADLYDRGYTDLVVCGRYDMVSPFASTDIYFGSQEPYSEDRHIRIPTPWAESVCAGRFTGGKLALAFAQPVYRNVRIFYQTEVGFEWAGYVDLPIFADQVISADLDGDGFDELVAVRSDFSSASVYWGGPEGIRVENVSAVPLPGECEIRRPPECGTLESNTERKIQVFPQIRAVVRGGRTELAWCTGEKVLFFEARGRQVTRCGETVLPGALAAAYDDARGILAVAARPVSFIVRKDGSRAAVDTPAASDAAISPEGIFFASNGNSSVYRCETLLCGPDGKILHRFAGEDTRRVFPVRNPGRPPEVFLVNHFSRSTVGYDRTFIYHGSAEGYSPERMTAVPSWCAVDSLCADLDDDGWPELLVGNNSENSLHLDPGHHLHHFGPGGFEPEKTRTLKTDIGWGVVAGDFNHDGYLEIVTPCNHWNDLRIFYGKDDFASYDTIEVNSKNSLRWLCAADLDNNGYLDIVAPQGAGRTLVLRGGPEGFSLERSFELATYRGLAATAADLTKNGYPDLIIGGHTETPRDGDLIPRQPHHSYVYIYWNGPEGLSEARKCMLRGDAADSFAVADFNNDGWLDIFAGSYHGGKDRDIHSFLYWNRKGHFSNLDRKMLFTHSASGAVACDFNEDGFVDLAVANHKIDGDHKGWSAVWWNGPDGFNEERCTRLPTNGPHGMTTIQPGNMLDRGPEEYYTSEPHKVEEDCRGFRVSLKAEIPEKTWVNVFLRSASDADGLVRAPWKNPGEVSCSAGDLIQYKLALGAVNGLRTPRISRVEVEALEP